MRAGFGKAELTPPLGVELAGYGYYLQRRAAAVADPLYARALLLEQGEQRALLVSCEVLGLSRTGNAAATLLAILVAVVIYGVLVIALRAITKDDLMLMPKGEKIARMLHL